MLQQLTRISSNGAALLAVALLGCLSLSLACDCASTPTVPGEFATQVNALHIYVTKVQPCTEYDGSGTRTPSPDGTNFVYFVEVRFYPYTRWCQSTGVLSFLLVEMLPRAAFRLQQKAVTVFQGFQDAIDQFRSFEGGSAAGNALHMFPKEAVLCSIVSGFHITTNIPSPQQHPVIMPFYDSSSLLMLYTLLVWQALHNSLRQSCVVCVAHGAQPQRTCTIRTIYLSEQQHF